MRANPAASQVELLHEDQWHHRLCANGGVQLTLAVGTEEVALGEEGEQQR